MLATTPLSEVSLLVGGYHSIVEAFYYSASRNADRIALDDGARQLDYRTVAEETRSLSARLLALGVRPGDVVATHSERSIETVLAWLAILQAGAAYLPLDPKLPAAARASILAEARPSLVLCAAGMPLDTGDIPCRSLEHERAAALAEPSAAPLPAADIDGETLAYIMYTSGSTGRPKGVLVPHRAVLRLVCGADYVTLTPATTILQLAPLAFDACTFEIWGALLNGGRLVIMTEALPTLDQIGRALRTHAVDTLWLTSGLFNLVVEHRLADLRGLRQLLAGGDVLSQPHVRRALDALPDCTLINGYGPTENTTFTCCYPVPASGWGEGSVPIGFPIAGTSVHILDEDMAPVADGAEGQLCAGGAGVALGYCGRPDLTAERFVADPFSTRPGSRLYLTGDMVRRRDDGAIVYCGRRDRQVKVSGFRIELDEIEHVLRGCPALADAAVALDVRDDGSKAILAFVRPLGGEAEEAVAAARTSLAAALPVYAHPHAIEVRPVFPLNANGKTDRAALLDWYRHARSGQAVPDQDGKTGPSGGTAALISTLLTALLGTRPDPRRNFFEIGATSLLLMRLQERLQSSLGRPVSITDLFAFPTVYDLAARLDRDGTAPARPDLAARARQQRAIIASASRRRP